MMHSRDTPRTMPLAWQNEAACRGMDPAIFFPGPGESLEPAKRVCDECLVRTECLELSIASPIADDGVWGGLSARARESYRRNRRTA